MKKSCKGCRALRCEFGTVEPFNCGMNYLIDKKEGIPLENCPKPKTYMRMIDLKGLQQKYNLTKDELLNWNQ